MKLLHNLAFKLPKKKRYKVLTFFGTGFFALFLYLILGLPSATILRDVTFQIPLRIYSADKTLIAEYGDKKRIPIFYERVPQNLINALLAAEDTRFFSHIGIDFKGLARATSELISTGNIKTGGSTITMQLAKNVFLTRERTFTRKFREILLALKIEAEFSKQEILELYVNKIYLGHRAYGIQAAAQVYYGKNVDELSLAQFAMMAGLPKAPSVNNPISNPDQARTRRDWILGRMYKLEMISEEAYLTALGSELTARKHSAGERIQAQYIAEMVRGELYDLYGENLYTEGYRVFTTIKDKLQLAANTSMHKGLVAYSKRHGYFGPEQQLSDEELLDVEALPERLRQINVVGDIEPALVVAVYPRSIEVLRANGDTVQVAWQQLRWARKHIGVNSKGPVLKQPKDAFKVGDIVRIEPHTSKQNIIWSLTQIPKVQGGLVSLDPKNGAIQALVGGFNFHHNKFNRVTQADRQLGSNIKPFIYTTALANGMSPATLINDAPVVFQDKQLESIWRPENFSKRFYGPTSLREALYKSRNLVSIRILRQIGIRNTINFLENFGFDPKKLPADLSLSLGTADVTPMAVAKGYARLANGGYAVEPYFIERIETGKAEVVFRAQPATVCEDCRYIAPEQVGNNDLDWALDDVEQKITTFPVAERVLDKQVSFLIYNMMQDVINKGTGIKALVLKRKDLAGKTGTTNDQKDAWFSGFSPYLATTVWVGFDEPKTLGQNEFGGVTALPIWIDYMRVGLKGKPNNALQPPAGVVSLRIDSKTGLAAGPNTKKSHFEYFRKDNIPMSHSSAQEKQQVEDSSEDVF